LVDAILQEMREGLDRDQVLKISKFGTFTRTDLPKRKARHPITGEEVSISAQRSVTFRPSRTLRKRINVQPLANKKAGEP
jgi:integration host factor subunit alpha